MSATQYQRNQILRLMRKLELDTRRITLMHRRIGVSDQWLDKPVDAWMNTLSVEESSNLIVKLEAMQ